MDTQTLHQQAESLREQEKYIEALKTYQEVIVKYQQEKNYSKLADALGGLSLTYKHLFLNSQDQIYVVLAQHSTQAALEIAKIQNDETILSRCYFNLAEIDLLKQEYSSAVANFTQSLALLKTDNAEKGRAIYHLGEAQWKNGQKEEGLANFHLGLETIEKYASDNDSYTINVWRSGCCLQIAVALKDDDKTQAEEYLKKAQEIIESDDRLTIRRNQLIEVQKLLQ
ncbi:MAG TPA: hypothetical protein PK639_01355 [Candidatus Woesebacteria bacterium]|nr:hypothetical protein [Candidatus Woesebacteria bacterium]